MRLLDVGRPRWLGASHKGHVYEQGAKSTSLILDKYDLLFPFEQTQT